MGQRLLHSLLVLSLLLGGAPAVDAAPARSGASRNVRSTKPLRQRLVRKVRRAVAISLVTAQVFAAASGCWHAARPPRLSRNVKKHGGAVRPHGVAAYEPALHLSVDKRLETMKPVNAAKVVYRRTTHRPRRQGRTRTLRSLAVELR